MKQLTLDVGLAAGPRLSNFWPGSNGAALQHLQQWLQAVVSGAASAQTPLYLWGPAASGKTHLLQAAGEFLREHGVDAAHDVGWLDATPATVGAYSERWQLVVLDDVQDYDVAQQQTAFNWFVNAQAGQRAVLAAGRLPPTQLLLREDLRSRLSAGHTFALQTLDEAACREVLRQSAQRRGLVLRDEVMDYLLHRFSRDLGSLMSLLDAMDSYSLQTQRAITIPLIKSMMDEL